MAIPKQIKREHVLQAIEKIEREGVPERCRSTKFVIVGEGRHYPPKYVLSISAHLAPFCVRITSGGILCGTTSLRARPGTLNRLPVLLKNAKT